MNAAGDGSGREVPLPGAHGPRKQQPLTRREPVSLTEQKGIDGKGLIDCPATPAASISACLRRVLISWRDNEFPVLEAILHTLSIQDVAHLARPSDRYPPYSATDSSVLPFRGEPARLGLLEEIQLERRTIGFRVGGIRDSLEVEGLGITAPTEKAPSSPSTIEEILTDNALNPDLSKKGTSETGQHTLVRSFEKYLTVLDEATGG